MKIKTNLSLKNKLSIQSFWFGFVLFSFVGFKQLILRFFPLFVFVSFIKCDFIPFVPLTESNLMKMRKKNFFFLSSKRKKPADFVTSNFKIQCIIYQNIQHPNQYLYFIFCILVSFSPAYNIVFFSLKKYEIRLPHRKWFWCFKWKKRKSKRLTVVCRAN